MQKKKSIRDICFNLFQKYADIRKLHKKSDIIEKDFEIVKDLNYFYLTLTNVHYSSFYKLLNIFKNDPSFCASMFILNPMKLVRTSDCIINYEKALELVEKFHIDININEKQYAWTYDMLLFQNNCLYMQQKVFNKLFMNEFGNLDNLEKFCSYFQINNNHYTTLTIFHDMEVELGDLLLDLYYNKINVFSKNIDSYLKSYQKSNDIKLTKQQVKAIENTIKNKFSIICGLPGTGKSTITKVIVDYFENDSICLVAPTGMAVNNLRNKCVSSNKTNVHIGTLHKMIYDQFDKIDNIDLMIIDEFSMVDIFMFKKILGWCSHYKCKLLILADDQQLPPIQAGYPLSALLSSKIFKVIKLKTIKRQDNGLLKNVILDLSDNKVVHPSTFDNKSIHFYNYSEENILKIQNKYKIDCKFITPQHKYNEGTININKILQKNKNNLQQTIYPSYKKTLPYYFHYNDLVVRITNDYKNEALYANGDIGIISKDVDDNIQIKYLETNMIQNVSKEELYEDFQLAYCLTVHKVQGSQYDNIVLIMVDNHEFSWNNHTSKKLLYTAISRAKKNCIILGNPELFMNAQKQNNIVEITYFLKKFNQYSF